jgi:hypothetical protein
VSVTSGQGAFAAGSSSQVGFFALQQKISTRATAAKQEPTRKKRLAGAAVKKQKNARQNDSPSSRPLPNQGQIKVAGPFSDEELQRFSVHLRLGAAALARHLRELNSGVPRGLGHRDPRPLDWAALDQAQYRFLIEQVSEARRGRGYLDMSGLKREQLVELWRFARFEANRAQRNMDHLAVPGNPVRPAGGKETGSPTADYLTAGHKLEARFYTFLAGQIETMVPASHLHAGEMD